MKKIGLLVLALVFALGTLGVGYAMWSDTVTIDGTVETGSVNLDIDSVSETYVYKVIDDIVVAEVIEYDEGDIICEDAPIVPLDQDDPLDGEDDLLLVASATTTDTTTGDDESVTMTFTNVFPTDSVDCPIVADVVIHYTGSIPAHVVMTGPTWDGSYDNLTAYLDFVWTYWENIGTPAVPVYGTPVVDMNPEDIQLHASDLLKLEVVIDGDQLQTDGLAAQGLYGEFDMSFMAHQWNETP